MKVVLFITIATLLASTDGLHQIKVPLTSIPGQHASCLPEDISEMTREMITASTEEVISGKCM